jgi:hypothetical protein
LFFGPSSRRSSCRKYVWFAPEDLKIGDRFHERIDESIRLYDKVMNVLSEASVQSLWVQAPPGASVTKIILRR